jgi:dihydrofolate reductase
MALNIIVAISENNIIGNGLEIPWRAKGEQKIFKNLTMGSTLIMGRKTYESIGKPLPGRSTIIITRQNQYKQEGCLIANTFDEAISLAVANDCDGEIFIAGGAQIYNLSIELATDLHLTTIHSQVEGDIFFPNFNLSDFELCEEKFYESNINYTYRHYKRIN